MQRGFRVFSICVAVILAAYFTWSGSGRQRPPVNIHLALDSLYEVYADSGKGNLLGIDPSMETVDYASRQHFLSKLDGYLQLADSKGWLKEKTVVVFPEHIGTWLVAEGQKASMLEAPTLEKAMGVLITSNFFSYIRDWFTAPDGLGDRQLHSLFSCKAVPMARTYQEVFGTLARKYRVTIVAGSILLPNPVIEKGVIRIRMGPLRNVTAVFNPDGSVQPRLSMKRFPTREEAPFVAGDTAAATQVYETPAGRLAVLICADAWYPSCYRRFNGGTPEIVAVPSFTPGDGSMAEAWQGYSGHAAPADVDTADVGRISLGQAWMSYTLPARLSGSGADAAILSTLRGRLWDLGSDGTAIAVRGDSSFLPPSGQGARMVNLHLR